MTVSFSGTFVPWRLRSREQNDVELLLSLHTNYCIIITCAKLRIYARGEQESQKKTFPEDDLRFVGCMLDTYSYSETSWNRI